MNRHNGTNGTAPDNDPDGHVTHSPALIVAFLIVVVMIIISVGGIFGIKSSSRVGNYYEVPVFSEEYEGIETTTPFYRRLPEYLCSPKSGLLAGKRDTDFITKTDLKTVSEAGERFYEKTGAEPYVLFMQELDGEICPDYDAVDDFLIDKYVSLFGEDEGHILFLFITDGSEYSSWYIQGNDAEELFGDELAETCLNAFDERYAEAGDLIGSVCGALEDAADGVMERRETFSLEGTEAYIGEDGVTTLTVRTPFYPEYDTRLKREDLIQCNIKGFFESDSEQAMISSRIDGEFTEATGVQPLILLSDDIDKEILADRAKLNALLKNGYETVFDDDAHIYLVLSLNDPEKPQVSYFVGPGARTVLDADACGLLAEYLETALAEKNGKPDALADAFGKAAKEIMTETYVLTGTGMTAWDETPTAKPEDVIIVWDDGEFSAPAKDSAAPAVAVIVIAVLLFAVTFIFVRRRMQVRRDENYDAHAKEKEHEKEAGYKGLESDFPVKCPKCSATAYLTENGCCQYCGTKIGKNR